MERKLAIAPLIVYLFGLVKIEMAWVIPSQHTPTRTWCSEMRSIEVSCTRDFWRLAFAVTLLSLLALSAFAEETLSGLAALQVPEGFVVEQAAGPPLVKYPMLGAFDDQGRLFVCGSAGKNLHADDLLKELPNFVRLLEDTDGDGQFDKSTMFADKLTLPTGAAWHDGALYVASAPSIWRLEDTDGDGVADRREELITGFTFRGHAGDVHGPYLGPNGRLYFVDGIMGHEIRDRSDRLLSKGKLARVFSSRLDGSDLETFCGGGMANPVAVTFNEVGEMFGATTFFNYNTQDRIRHDALFHSVYGGVYPRRVGLLRDEFKLTGPLLEPLTRFGMSAPSNLKCYRGTAFGEDYRGNIFVSHFNTRRVTRARLEREGATFRAGNEPFLVSADPDFHPCDIIEDADGSLLVIDTGGWFKIGCPTSSLQPEVRGAIYRIRRANHPRTADPRGAKIAWDASSAELASLLNDDRVAVRDRGIATLAERGNPAVPALRELLHTESVRARRNAVWALTRIGTPEACATTRHALEDTDPDLRLVASTCAATHRDAGALSQLVGLLDDDEPAVRREAATALGRIGKSEAVTALLKAFKNAGCRILEHAIIYALIEIDASDETLVGLRDASPAVRRAALIATDQMESGTLTRESVSPLLKTDDVRLLESVVDVVSRQPQWCELVADLLRSWLLAPEFDASRQTMLRETLYRLRREPACQAIIAEVLSHQKATSEARVLLLNVMIDSGFGEFPAIWQEQVLASLESADLDVAKKALDAMASTNGRQFDEGLMNYTQDATLPVSLRTRAVSILAGSGAAMPDVTFEFLRAQCSPEAAFETRLDAARALSKTQLTLPQVHAVIALVAQAGPLELPLLLQPLGDAWQYDSDKTARQLVAALDKSPGFASLHEDQLAMLFASAPTETRNAAEPLFRRLKAEYATSLRQVLRTVFNQAGGDAARGKEIFFGKQALCSACHRAGPEKGKEIGPDLRRIGEVRSHRDLLEAILAPNASFARGFEPKTIVTNSGRVVSGVIRGETDDSVTLYTSQREEVHIPREEIEEIAASHVSIMPQGLERTLTPDELRDLLAFLSSLKLEAEKSSHLGPPR